MYGSALLSLHHLLAYSGLRQKDISESLFKFLSTGSFQCASLIASLYCCFNLKMQIQNHLDDEIYKWNPWRETFHSQGIRKTGIKHLLSSKYSFKNGERLLEEATNRKHLSSTPWSLRLVTLDGKWMLENTLARESFAMSLAGGTEHFWQKAAAHPEAWSVFKF